MNILLIVLVIIAAVVIAIISIYNTLIAKKNQVSNILAGVDTQLKKRYDLIPNLVASVKEYLTHEKSVLERVTELRSQAMNSSSEGEKFSLNNEISKLLGTIKVSIEAYPELRANENLLHLQATLMDVEEQISAARRAYNGAVMEYNNSCEMFPMNLIANTFSFKKSEFFSAEESERVNPNVSELFGQNR